MIGMQHEDGIECMHQDGIRLIFLAGRTKHHIHEVGGITQIIARIHERLTDRVFISHRHNSRKLGDNAVEAKIAVLRVGKILGIVIEGRQRADHANHDRHRVRVAPKALIELGHLLMHHSVRLDDRNEIAFLFSVRQLAVFQQISHIKEVAVFGQLLDRIAAIEQHALLAIDEGDF